MTKYKMHLSIITGEPACLLGLRRSDARDAVSILLRKKERGIERRENRPEERHSVAFVANPHGCWVWHVTQTCPSNAIVAILSPSGTQPPVQSEPSQGKQSLRCTG